MAPFLNVARFLSASFAIPPRDARQAPLLDADTATVSVPANGAPSLLMAAASSSFGQATLRKSGPYKQIDNPRTSASLSDLARLLGAEPTADDDLLYLSSNTDGERGTYLSRPVEKGQVILEIPLSSCIRDDAPPSWFSTAGSDWAARLAASMLDVRLHGTSAYPDGIGDGLSLWLSMLPDENLLRASLPVHWSEETIANARCTALEVAADSSYFARAEAIADITSHLLETQYLAGVFEKEDLEALAHDALDLVQTRSVQVGSADADGAQWGPPLRIIAPIFDFINHGYSSSSSSSGTAEAGDGSANASYGLERRDGVQGEQAKLVVRAKRDMNSREEVLLDYGVHARPAWRCLNRYGFVPTYPDMEEEGTDSENKAEVFVAGARYEVGTSTIPVEMVEAATIAIAEEQLSALEDQPTSTVFEYDDFGADASLLTPDVAIPIAKRLSEVAFLLILEPGVVQEEGDDYEMASAEDVVGAKLAASLRWSQFQVLLSCAAALREYAAEEFE